MPNDQQMQLSSFVLKEEFPWFELRTQVLKITTLFIYLGIYVTYSEN